jgi:RNA polymerase sigma-70 factor (ECF subfamily)
VPGERDAIYHELLVIRCRRGDPAAPGELVACFQRALVYYLRRLVGDEAEAWDLAQETWLSVFRSLHALQNPRALAAYLYRTARNAAMAHLRRRHLWPSATDDGDPPDVPSDAPSVDDALFAREDAARLHAAIGQLPLPQREAVTLHFLQDLSIDEIANVLDVPAGTVKSRIFHAKLALRNLLGRRQP